MTMRMVGYDQIFRVVVPCAERSGNWWFTRVSNPKEIGGILMVGGVRSK
jgi:hypothetical protein